MAPACSTGRGAGRSTETNRRSCATGTVQGARAVPSSRGGYRLTLSGKFDGETVGEQVPPRVDVQVAVRPSLAGRLRPGSHPLLAVADATVEIDPRNGSGSLDFDVPAALALRHDDWRCEVVVHGSVDGGFRVAAADIDRVADDAATSVGPASPTPSTRLRGRRKVVIIGNCQSEILRQGFAQIETLSKLFDVKYHFIQLPKNLHEFATRDLETCDVLLYQDIRLWDEFPLRDCVRDGADLVPFPLVRFASLWAVRLVEWPR